MKSYQWFVRIFVALLLLTIIDAQVQVDQAATPPQPNCRFGITSPNGLDTNSPAEMQTLQVGGYLDWNEYRPSSLPVGVDYINVLRVGNRCSDNLDNDCSTTPTKTTYYQTQQTLTNNVKSHPGAYWEVGNEPDTTYSTQDNITAKDYADRFYDLATQIQKLDSSAKIGFGTVVQPTPIRIRYLNLAWAELIIRAGSPQAASALINFWAVHAFILNELPGQWGTGVPLGFEKDHKDAQAITDWSQTYSITLFDQRVQAFRSWMASKGEQDKPLWITEYGSLLPPINAPGKHYVTVSDALTAKFMTSSFDFMLNTTNPRTGMPDDGYHLVQRWFWYSLNNDRTSLGGTLYDPLSTPVDAITPVGTAFVNYKPRQAVAPDYAVEQPSVQSDPGDATQFQINFNLLDSGNNTAPAGVKWYVYADNPNGTPVATFTTPRISGCAETRTITASLPYISTANGKLYIKADTTGDTNPANNLVELDANVPTNLRVTARSTNKIVLQWNYGGSSSDSFDIERSPDGSNNTWKQINSTPVQNATSYIDLDPNLKPGTQYFYRVRVDNNEGVWGASIAASDTTQGTGAPPTPTAVTAQAISNRQIYITWFNKYDHTQYHVERSKDGSSWSEIAVVSGVDSSPYTTVYLDRGLDINQTYYYRLRAWNSSGGYSGYSSVVTAKTYPYGAYLPLIQ